MVHTGSTGVASTNYVKGRTMHNLFSLGIVMPPDKKLNDIYSNVDVRAKIKKRLGGAGIPGNVVLIIDEVTVLPYDVLGTVERLLRIVYDNDVPFGGINVVLVGDFDQKLSPRGGNLAQVLVNSVTDPIRWMSKQEALRLSVAIPACQHRCQSVV